MTVLEGVLGGLEAREELEVLKAKYLCVCMHACMCAQELVAECAQDVWEPCACMCTGKGLQHHACLCAHACHGLWG